MSFALCAMAYADKTVYAANFEPNKVLKAIFADHDIPGDMRKAAHNPRTGHTHLRKEEVALAECVKTSASVISRGGVSLFVGRATVGHGG